MPQLHWTLFDIYDQKYEVGLFHAAKNGHLLVHCNEEIMLIDFFVVENKDYHFYMGPELVNLNLTKDENDQFTYGLIIDKQTKTPLNDFRRRQARKEKLKLFILLIGFILLVVILYYLIYKRF